MRLTKVRAFLGATAVLAFAVLVSDANGAYVVGETFSYPDGDLVPNDPPVGLAWNAHSGAGSLPVQVSSGTISLAQGSGSREDVNAPFQTGPIGDGDVMYSGFDLTVPDPGAAITNTYFAHFLEGTSSFAARVWITAPTTSGYRLALSNDSSITDGDGEAFTGDLAFGSTYRVVTKYDFDNANSMLWIDPVNEASASISATDPGFSDNVEAYAFRQAAGNTIQIIDCLSVATTFDEAMVCIPEPSTVALMVLALGLVGLGRRSTR